MSELSDQLKDDFQDKEIRHAYCNEFLNAYLATQIKVLREQQGLTQAQLAKLAKMKQSRISTLEDVNYDSWSLNTLKRLSEAFDVALTVKFDSFGTKLNEIEQFGRQSLQVCTFDEDIVFAASTDHTSIIKTDNVVDRFVITNLDSVAYYGIASSTYELSAIHESRSFESTLIFGTTKEHDYSIAI